MSIKSIPLKTWEVQAILEDRKTVTRRKVDAKSVEAVLSSPARIGNPELSDRQFVECLCTAPCEAGDVLWVRETWSPVWVHPIRYLYKCFCPEAEGLPVRWHPSIHMPKAAARLFLRVYSVRVEKLQEISPVECVREGVERTALEKVGGAFARGIFHDIWESTIKPTGIFLYGWYSNPWVWVIEFERCERPDGWV